MGERKNTFSVIAIIVGIIAILLGLYFVIFLSANDTFYSRSSSGTKRLGTEIYGADFYTDEYKATAFAGNGISAIYHVLCYGIGAFFIMGGIIDICYFIQKLPKKEKESKQNKKETIVSKED